MPREGFPYGVCGIFVVSAELSRGQVFRPDHFGIRSILADLDDQSLCLHLDSWVEARSGALRACAYQCISAQRDGRCLGQ